MAEQLTAQQRAQLFAVSTRQNLQMIVKESATSTPTTLQLTLPKARLLSGCMLRVKGTVNLKHETLNTIDSDIFTNYRAIRKVSMDFNNGFAPFTLSGEECAMFNMIDLHPNIVAPSLDKSAYNYAPTFKASPTGVDNDFAFTLQLNNTLNGRDPIGLILLQNDQTNVIVNVDFGMGSEMFKDIEGLVAELKNVSVESMVETFSVPANESSYPDLSVLRIVNGRTDSMPSSGQQIIKLSTGTIYRKIIIRVSDEMGLPVDDDWILSTIDLCFNQADTNYSIRPELLRIYNQKMLGYALPKGMYVLDFSNCGAWTNLGGSRDLIDTANLSELWLKFSTQAKGKVDIVTECLSRLS